MCIKCSEPFDTAYVAYIKRLELGWKQSRDGFGFLIWKRGDDWTTMTEEEAGVYHFMREHS